ncbi:hypothetical protein FACS189445_4320 [Spirochaetia bacterium]|nr:hypothetical protein FACS189445_4320 [Spirochaetia bacterium]
MAARETAGTPVPIPVTGAPVQREPVGGKPAGETPELETPKPVPCRDLTELRLAIIKSLSQDRGILASGIEKSLPWKWATESMGSAPSGEGKLLIPVRDTLTAELLKKEYPLIRQMLGELWGKPLTVMVVEAPDGGGDPVKEPELPPQAELVLRMFRGTVVKKSNVERNDAN